MTKNWKINNKFNPKGIGFEYLLIFTFTVFFNLSETPKLGIKMKKIILFLIAPALCLIINSCNFNGISADEKMCIPEELILGKLIFSERKTHFIGPSGLDYGLLVYKLDENSIDTIKNGNLLFPTFPDYQIKKFKSHTTKPPTYRLIMVQV